MTNTTDSREIALDCLLEICEKEQYSHIVLRQALNKYQFLEKQERALISRIVEGTLEYRLQMDYILNLYSKTKTDKMKPLIRNLLRMSVYQIMYMDRIPDSAVCNEAVKLASKRGFQGLKGFVNGVLRSIVRGKADLAWPNDSVKYSIPGWILKLWKKQYPEETIQTMLEAFFKAEGTTVRCNLDKADREEILQSLKNQGVTVAELQNGGAMIRLSGYDYLESLEAFAKGWIQVQDISSSFVGDIADPKEGNYVIDVCGAPGGKSLHIADKLHGTGMVEVRDLTEYKVSMIEENIARTGAENMRTRVQDALELRAEDVESADIVIADLPCSGLGIIGKKPDIRYRMTLDQCKSLAELQRDILAVVHQYVKPGGLLIYSTCTIDKLENEDNVAWFLENCPFEAVDISGKLDEAFAADTMKQGYVQLLPGVNPCDGFFIAAFRKK